MKGLSILASLLLLVLAHYLAGRMRQAGTLPASDRPPAPSSTFTQSNIRPGGPTAIPRTYSL